MGVKLIRSIIAGLWLGFTRVLRFANVLEPDVPFTVLSISKISMWVTVGLMFYMCKNHPDDAGGLGAAITANVASFGNYAYRRHVQAKAKKGSFAELRGTNTEIDGEG